MRERKIAMKSRNASPIQKSRRIVPIAYATVLAVAFTVSLTQPARATTIILPDMPPNVRVDEPNKVFLVGHAVGTQNYVCLPAGVDAQGHPRFAFKLFTPEATLFTDDLKQLTTHFFSPNLNPNELETSPTPPFADGPIRATWQHSRDSSIVWAEVKNGDASTDSGFVKDGAVAWLKLTVVGSDDGPTGGDTLSKSTFVQRLNTSGGLAPKTGCGSLEDVGTQAFMPYTADYFFYKKQ
jgi:uncharacterized protein DUF3455